MPEEVWTSPKGMYKVITYTPEGYVEQTREEWTERLGLDLSAFQIGNDETPEERAERIARARADVKALFEEIGFTPTEEQIAEAKALSEYVGWKKTPSGEDG